jgi:hypothetical protein
MKRPRRTRKPTSTPHQRQLKAARNRRYYERQQQRDRVFKQLEDKARVYPLVLRDSEAIEMVIDVDFEKGEGARVLRKFGSRGVVGWVAASFVREKLKLKKK